MSRVNTAVWLFGITSVLCFVAALIPMVKGGDMNVVMLGVAVVFLVIAAVSARKPRTPID